MTAQTHQAAIERLRRLGQRYTTNREAIVSSLEHTTKPLTIPEILSTNADLAMSSVYRNLTLLEQAGIVHRIVTSDEYGRYELAEDLTEDHHHHLICVNCGGVEDFRASAHLEHAASESLQKAATRVGFSVRSHRLDVLGLCRSCA